jgi:hypothetical protein
MPRLPQPDTTAPVQEGPARRTPVVINGASLLGIDGGPVDDCPVDHIWVAREQDISDGASKRQADHACPSVDGLGRDDISNLVRNVGYRGPGRSTRLP